MSDVVLYDFWLSSASYRARIALNLAGISYRSVPVSLATGQQKSPEHHARNPQELVPALAIDGLLLTQSLSIIEYLDETRPGLGLLPANAAGRANMRAVAYAIAMDIQPVCNLRVVLHVMEITGKGEPARQAWMQKFIGEGLAAVEAMLQSTPGPLCFGETPTLADICLVPQVFNARRWNADISGCKRILDICGRLEKLDAFTRAHPDRVKPAA